MSRRLGERVFFWLLGAAVGAAAQGVAWTFWAWWGVAWATVWIIGHWHRSTNGNGAENHA